MPSISVIIPVYQAEKLLQACVESVRKQTFSDWELLLIDDGSQDASPAMCDAYAAQDHRIKVFHKPNGGVSSARNLGLQKATGDCIAFLDADDAFVPQTLETLWAMRLQSDMDTAGCAHWNVTPNGETSVEQLLAKGIYDSEAVREQIIAPLVGERLALPLFNGFIWRYLFDAQILRDNQITFEGAYLEDELFLIEYFCHAKGLAVTDEPLYRYLLNPNSATHKYMKDYQQVFGRFMERKAEIVSRLGLESLKPQWRENSNWAGLLIAIGNEYAKDNPKSMKERQNTVIAWCQRAEMAEAIRTLKPTGMGRNKQMVADLVCRRQFTLLTLLYRLKNRM